MNAEEKQQSEKLIESHWIYQGKIIKLRQDAYRFHDQTKLFELIDHPGAVVLLPIDSQGRILLLTRTPNS